MSKIKSIAASQLNNGDFYQLMENTAAIASAEPALAGVAEALLTMAPIMTNSFRKELQTLETKQIVALDELRDRGFVKIKRIVEGYLYDDNVPANMEAAKLLQTFVKLYGGADLIKFDYNKQTAFVTNFVIDVQTHANSAADTLGLGRSFKYLADCNERFKEFYSQRGDAAAIMVNLPPFYKLRKEVLVLFQNFITDVDSLQRFNPAAAPQVEAIINRLNVEIDKFRLLVPRTKAGSDLPEIPAAA